MADKREGVCGLCFWWSKTNHFDVGECRRHAPKPSATLRYQSSDHLPEWPITATRDWCGDFMRDFSRLPEEL